MMDKIRCLLLCFRFFLGSLREEVFALHLVCFESVSASLLVIQLVIVLPTPTACLVYQYALLIHMRCDCADLPT